MVSAETKQLKISRTKLFSILSLFSAIVAGRYFITGGLPEAAAFTAMASIFDSASIGTETANQKNWSVPLKNALDRIADSAIFIGFAMSGMVSELWGTTAIVLVIVLPYWVKLIWKISIRRFFHAALIARVIYFLAYWA